MVRKVGMGKNVGTVPSHQPFPEAPQTILTILTILTL
jgi:hypothetical protein